MLLEMIWSLGFVFFFVLLIFPVLEAKEIFFHKFRLTKIKKKKKKKKKKERKKEKKGLPDFTEITVDGSSESLLMAF
jgi:hypothetical protein